ncbi:MAG: autotransporter-associated beta strand repeat-containing protein [Hydrogenophaga sp.]|uniref:autotransporter-associated beta strand repeat-containing protein n=1 Tax=Hydrogenophaga sp. TaxID=1904254 RepID=UPI0025BE251A|nr:autotransporter-associated beta strand repeat-containing protein [Hydrogenophaga sp.]MBU7574014.1 autotransporter-associated beta strand repeat-containing protein [Hydrogenophaga sp.]
MKKMHIAPMESISKPGERAPWLREGKWWRLLMIAGSLLVGAASSSHAQTLIWAPFSSDCSAASLGGGGATQYWHSSATPKNWCTSIGGSKSSWTDTFTLSGAVGGTGDLTKIGSGRLVLTSTSNSHTGQVLVNGGSLWVDGNLASTGVGLNYVKLAAGTTLGGGGSILRGLDAGGVANTVLSPGGFGAAGTLTMSGVQFYTTLGSQLDFQLSQPGVQGGLNNDLLDITVSYSGSNAIEWGSSNSKINISHTTGGTLSSGVYPIIKYNFSGGGGMAGLPTLGTLPPGMVGAVLHNPTTRVISVALGSSASLRWAPNSADCVTNLGGNGAWDDAVNYNWCTVDNTKSPWLPGSTAVFPGNPGTVTVSAAQSIAGLDFQAPGMVLSGAALTGSAGSQTLLTAGTGITATVNNALAGSLPYAKEGVGTITLGGANTFTGALTVNAGTLAVSNASGLGSTADGTTVQSTATLDILGAVGAEPVTLNGGTLKSSNGTRSLSGAVTLTADSTVDVGGTSLTLSSAVSGSGNFKWTKSGTGNLIVTGVNSTNGELQVAGGTFTVGDGTTTSSSIESVSKVTVDSGATLVFNRTGSTPAFSKNIEGAGAVQKLGTDTLILTGSWK